MINEILLPIHLIFVFSMTVIAIVCGPFVSQTMIALFTVFANIFVIKKMLVGGVLVGGCDMYIVGSICCLLMGREMWGERFAHDATKITLAISVAFLVLSWFQVQYVPLPTDTINEAFIATIGQMPLVTLWSILVHYIAQTTTLFLVNFFVYRSAGRASISVSFVAMMIGQILDSTLFFGGIFGLESSWGQLCSMITVSAGFKIVLIAMSSLLIGLASLLRRHGYAQ